VGQGGPLHSHHQRPDRAPGARSIASISTGMPNCSR
jgi:hypothetical protein